MNPKKVVLTNNSIMLEYEKACVMKTGDMPPTVLGEGEFDPTDKKNLADFSKEDYETILVNPRHSDGSKTHVNFIVRQKKHGSGNNYMSVPRDVKIEDLRSPSEARRAEYKKFWAARRRGWLNSQVFDTKVSEIVQFYTDKLRQLERGEVT